MSESRLRWLLVISFGLNLFLLGIMAARAATMIGMHHRHHEMMAMHQMGPMGAGGPVQRLSEADRDVLHKAMESLKPSDADRETRRQRWEQMRKLAQADSFDADSFRTLLRQGAEERAKHQQQ